MSKPSRKRKPKRTQKKSGYRRYLERCRSAGRPLLGFDDFLVIARRWRLEYEPATVRGDVSLMRELEDLLCEPRRPWSTDPGTSSTSQQRKSRTRAPV